MRIKSTYAFGSRDTWSRGQRTCEGGRTPRPGNGGLWSSGQSGAAGGVRGVKDSRSSQKRDEELVLRLGHMESPRHWRHASGRNEQTVAKVKTVEDERSLQWHEMKTLP